MASSGRGDALQSRWLSLRGLVRSTGPGSGADDALAVALTDFAFGSPAGGGATATVEGTQATAAAGSISAGSGAHVDGVAATSATGAALASGGATASGGAVAASAALGSVSAGTGAHVDGALASSQTGNSSGSGGGNANGTGVSAAAGVGEVNATGGTNDAVAVVEGVSATGSAGLVLASVEEAAPVFAGSGGRRRARPVADVPPVPVPVRIGWAVVAGAGSVGLAGRVAATGSARGAFVTRQRSPGLAGHIAARGVHNPDDAEIMALLAAGLI